MGGKRKNEERLTKEIKTGRRKWERKDERWEKVKMEWDDGEKRRRDGEILE